MPQHTDYVHNGKTAKAFAPGNISLLFQVVSDPDPAIMGSKGVGFTTHEGATVEVFKSEGHITYNGKRVDLPTVSSVIEALTDIPISVSITSPLPLGSGFGMSGASALAASYAINALLYLEKTDLELAKIAHQAEVINKTGLGDVVNQYFGGFFAKFVPSSKFEVKKLPIDSTPVYCISFGKLLTSSILTNTKMINKINSEAEKALQIIRDSEVSFANITSTANRFTQNCGLQTPQVAKRIADVENRGGHAAQILLGNAVVSDIPFEGAIKLTMGTRGAHLITESA